MLKLLCEIYPRLGSRLSIAALLQTLAAALELSAIVLIVAVTSAVGGADAPTSPLSPSAASVASRSSVAWLLTALATAFLMRAAVQGAAIQLWARWVEEYERSHRAALLDALLSANWSLQSREPAGRLQHLLTHHTESVAKAFTSLSWSCSHGLTGLVLAVGALWTSPVIAVAGALLLASFALLFRRQSRRSREAVARRAAALGTYVNLLGQSLPLLRELRVFGATSKLTERAAVAAAEISRMRRVQNVVGAATPCCYQTAAGLTLVAGLAISLLCGHSLAAALAGLILLVRAAAAAQHAHATLHQLQDAVPFLEEMRVVLREYRAERVPDSGLTLERIDSLECADVSFGYEAEQAVLEGVRLRMERGEVIGVVGASGEGKTTLLHIVMRLLTPTSGSLLVNGRPAELFSTKSWHARTAPVPQEPAMFQESIAECIRFGRDWITDQQIRAAANDAGLLEEIAAMPGGMETLVGERGSRLSFGQRQRVCIARALAGGPDLLILDEPTAALDADSEERIVQTLERLRGRTTVLVVTHRPALLRACDKVVEIRSGRAVVKHNLPPQTRETQRAQAAAA